jgi:hypothetical protein
MCRPTLVVADKDITSIAVDASDVFWTTPKGVFSAPASSGSPIAGVATKSKAFALVVDGGSLYWRQADGSVWTTTSGGKPKRLAPATTLGTTNEVGGLAVDGGTVYWAESDTIWKVAATGGAPSIVIQSQVTTTTGGGKVVQAFPMRSVVVDGGEIEWLQKDLLRIGPVTPTLGAKFVGYGGECGVLASKGNDLVVFDPENFHVVRSYSRKTGGSIAGPMGPWVTLNKKQPCVPTAAAIDGAFVYVTLPAGIARVPLAGGDETILADTSTGVAIAVDASYVYFADATGIERVAK